MKKVSIIIPCYNYSKYVGEAIQSALNQTYQNIEIICINDASQDNSAEVIQKYANQYPQIVFIDEKKNIGVIEARNKAVLISQGDYIFLLDADNKIHSTYVEKAVNILENNSQIGVVYAKACFFGDKEGIWELEKFNKNNMLFHNCVDAAALFRKTDFLRIGGFNQNMRGGYEDWDLWLSFIENNFDFYRIEEVLFFYRMHGRSRSEKANKIEEHLYKTIINNHYTLYSNFLSNNRNMLIIKSKYYKYRFIFKILLVIVILQLLIIIGLII